MVLIGLSQAVAGSLLIIAGCDLIRVSPPSVLGAILVCYGIYTLYNSVNTLPPTGA